MHVDHNMHVIGWNMHVTCTLFRIGMSILDQYYNYNDETMVHRYCKLVSVTADIPSVSGPRFDSVYTILFCPSSSPLLPPPFQLDFKSWHGFVKYYL